MIFRGISFNLQLYNSNMRQIIRNYEHWLKQWANLVHLITKVTKCYLI